MAKKRKDRANWAPRARKKCDSGLEKLPVGRNLEPIQPSEGRHLPSSAKRGGRGGGGGVVEKSRVVGRPGAA